MSHLTIYIILYYYLPQVCRSTRRQNHTSTTGHHVMSPPLHISYFQLLPTTGQHVVKTFRIILYCRSTCPHLGTSLILYYYYYYQQEVYMSTRGGGMGVTSAWSPLGNFLEGQAHPNVFAFCLPSNQVFLFFVT